MNLLFGGDQIDQIVEELWKVPGWPQDPVRDRALVKELMEQFPGTVTVDEIQKFRVWLIEHGSGNEGRSRGRTRRVREWFSRAFADRGRKATAGAPAGPGPAKRRTSTRARPAAAFGPESSDRLVDW
jgi:hypothetical protein